MCGGGSKSADAYYEEMKPDPVDLPSLSVGDKATRNISYGNVKTKRTGKQRRSLFSAFGLNNGDNP